MADNSIIVSRSQTRAVRRSVSATAALAVTPTLVVLFLSFVSDLATVLYTAVATNFVDTPSVGEGRRPYLTTVWAKIPAAIGKDAVDDAGWILPTLLTLLVAIYVADFGQRKREMDPHIKYASSSLPRSLRLLALAGNVIAAYTINYILLAIATVALFGEAGGHLLGVIGVGIWIVVLGTMVGAFWIVSAKWVLGLNALQQANTMESLNRLRNITVFEGRGRSLVRVITWVVVPFAIAGAAFVVSATMKLNDNIVVVTATVALFVGAQQVLMAIGTFCFNSEDARSGSWLIVTLAVTAWAAAGLMILSSALVSLVLLTGWVQLAVAIPVALLSIGMCIAWLPIRALERSWAWWTPSYAAKTIAMIDAGRRMKRLRFEAHALEAEVEGIAKRETEMLRGEAKSIADRETGHGWRGSLLTLGKPREKRPAKR